MNDVISQIAVGLTFLIIINYLISYCIAGWFYEAAKAKGFYDKKYFWICFWLGLPGWLLVIALPDRGNAPQVLSDELPDI